MNLNDDKFMENFSELQGKMVKKAGIWMVVGVLLYLFLFLGLIAGACAIVKYFFF